MKFLFLFLSLISSLAFAQVDTTTVNDEYISSTSDLLNVRLGVESKTEEYDLIGDGFEYDLRPNVSSKVRLSLNYSIFAFSLSFTPRFIPGNSDYVLKGKTTIRGVGMDVLLSHFIQSVHYEVAKGFFMYNTGDFIPNWDNSTGTYIQFPDLKVKAFKGETAYKLNEDFSLKAIQTQTERQHKSAGSFIPGILYSYYIIDNKSSDQNQQTSQKSDAFEILINCGYYHNFVLNEKWYLALKGGASGGVNYTELTTRLESGEFKTYYSDPIYRLNGLIGFGYNADRFFAGAIIRGYKSFRNENRTTVQLKTTSYSYQVFIGLRFKSPKFLRLSTNKALKKMNEGKEKVEKVVKKK